jgi:Protein of unknown function (DUF2384)
VSKADEPPERAAPMSVEEFHAWQAGEPNLHELIEGRAVRLSPGCQASRRFMRAARVANGTMGQAAATAWLATPHDALGGRPPQDVLAEGWRGLAEVLRLLPAENWEHPGWRLGPAHRSPASVMAEAGLRAEAEEKRPRSQVGGEIEHD